MLPTAPVSKSGTFARVTCVLVAVFSLWTGANAQITLNVDTSTQTFWFSGSATGAPFNDINAGYVTWQGGAGSYSASFDLSSAFSSTNSTVTGAYLYKPGVGSTSFGLNVDLSIGTPTTLSTNPVAVFDYSGFTAETKASLENTSSVFPANGTGFGNLVVQQVSSIPEPSTYAAIFSGAVLAIALTVRRRKVAASNIV